MNAASQMCEDGTHTSKADYGGLTRTLGRIAEGVAPASCLSGAVAQRAGARVALGTAKGT